MFDIPEFAARLDQLVAAGKMSPLTKNDYVSALISVNKGLPVSGKRASPAELEEVICRICAGKSQYGKVLSAVSKYEQLVAGRQRSILYGEPLARMNRMRSVSSGVEPRLPESTYLRKINRLNNPTLKLAFRLEAKSGLRIDELAALKKRDVMLLDGEIRLHVRSGKGRKARIVQVMEDPYLYQKLQAHLEQLPNEKEAPLLPYTKSYLKKQAHKHEIRTHDLRRINARMRFRKSIGDGSGKRSARREVAKELGHNRVKITNLYLGSEWKEDREEEEIEQEKRQRG